MIDRRLRVLQAIERHGTVTAAAKACALTTSAASHQMRELARELRVVLLEPEGRGVRLTPAARTLLAGGERLLERWEQIKADLAGQRGPVEGELRFCAFSTAAAAVATPALEDLRGRHPALELALREAEPAQAFDLLRNEEVDIALVVATPDIPATSDRAFEQMTLYDEPLDLLVAAGHPSLGRSDVALIDFAEDDWICSGRGGAYHQLVTLACASAGFAPRIAHQINEWDTGAALVARGFGVAPVPRLAELPARHDTRRVRITVAPIVTRCVIVAVRSGCRAQPPVTAGLHALQRVCDALDGVVPCPARAEKPHPGL